MKQNNKQILYSVEVFFDKESFGEFWADKYGTWGGGSTFGEFKRAFEIYKNFIQTYPKTKYRIISSNGYVRMKSHK